MGSATWPFFTPVPILPSSLDRTTVSWPWAFQLRFIPQGLPCKEDNFGFNICSTLVFSQLPLLFFPSFLSVAIYISRKGRCDMILKNIRGLNIFSPRNSARLKLFLHYPTQTAFEDFPGRHPMFGGSPETQVLFPLQRKDFSKENISTNKWLDNLRSDYSF